jgi:hypothetical protein
MFESWRADETEHFYIGMTDDLVRRVWQHRTGALPWLRVEWIGYVTLAKLSPVVKSRFVTESEGASRNRQP